MRSDELDRETFERFMDLQKLRNSVAHASKFSPDPSDVMEYINRAEELAITLTSILNRLNTPQSQERAGPITP
ncbi:MAG TPA: hypothetical protein DIW85_20650 [Stenotrophomonas sp.]|nr:hypothetical protein [Stenotrophomonas sp.]